MAAIPTDHAHQGARRVTGAFAVASGRLLLVASPLYVIPGPAPLLQNAATFTDHIVRHKAIAVTTKLVDAIYIAGFIVFISGFRQLIRMSAPLTDAWMADLVFGAGLVMQAVVLVGDVLAGGAALDTLVIPDPTAVRALTEASLVAFGAIGFLMTALFLAATSYGILKAHMARLAGWVGYILAALNVAAVPTIYKGNDFLATVIISGGNTASGLYSCISAITGLIYSVWLVALGVVILRNRSGIWMRGKMRANGRS
jgi:hypothetical protein